MSVLPADVRERLRRYRLVTRKPFHGSGAGERRTRHAGVSTDFLDHRPYAPGDDLRHLDWNLFARFDRLHLKRYHDQQDVTLHVVVDASASMGFGTPPKIDLARSVAAALGWTAVAAGERARVHVVGSGEPGSSIAFAGRARLHDMLLRIERVEAGGAVTLDAAFGEVARRIRRPGVVVVLSDLFAEGAVRGLERLAAGRHQLCVGWILAPEDGEPDADPRLRADILVEDSETGARMPVSLSPALRAAYRDALAAHEEDLRATARRLGALMTRLSTATPLEDVLFRHLRADGWIA